MKFNIGNRVCICDRGKDKNYPNICGMIVAVGDCDTYRVEWDDGEANGMYYISHLAPVDGLDDFQDRIMDRLK